MGNVQSLVNGLLKIQTDVVLNDKTDLCKEYEICAVPGVGAFTEGMEQLKKRNLVNKIKYHLLNGGGLIGICLGMQMFFEKSHEYETVNLLSLLNGEVSKMNNNFNNKDKLLLPHIDWNNLEEGRIENDWIKDFVNLEQYFVNSFAVNQDFLNQISSFCKLNMGIITLYQL